MFGIGLSELAVIACVALVLVRPKDLPKLFRLLGKAYARAKRYFDQVSAMKDDMLSDLGEEERDEEGSRGPGAGAEETFRPYEGCANPGGEREGRGAGTKAPGARRGE